MSEPFDFFDEDTDEDCAPGIAWLPLALGGLALAGFLVIPILGLFRGEKPVASEWTAPKPSEPVEVMMDPPKVAEMEEPIQLTPDPEDHLEDLASVDETLSNLGFDFSQPEEADEKIEVEPKALPRPREMEAVEIEAKPRPFIKEIKLERKSLGSLVSSGQSGEGENRYQVKKGDTLYSIARQARSTPGEIAELNGMKTSDPILVGHSLRLPGHASGLAERKKRKDDPVAISRPGKEKREPTAISRPPKKQSSQSPPKLKPVPIDSPIKRGPPKKLLRPSDNIAQHRPSRQEAIGQEQPRPEPLASPYPVAKQPRSLNRAVPGTTPRTWQNQTAMPRESNPLDKYNSAIAYRVQMFDNMNRIADAHATTPEELIELNGRSNVKKGEMVVVPVDNCRIK